MVIYFYGIIQKLLGICNIFDRNHQVHQGLACKCAFVHACNIFISYVIK